MPVVDAPPAGQEPYTPPEAALVGGVTSGAPDGEPAFGSPPADPVQRLAEAERREDDALVAARTEQVEADAERRIREVEQIQVAAESNAASAAFEAQDEARRAAMPPPPPAPISGELELTDQQIERRRRRDEELQAELEKTEVTIESHKGATEQALEEAQRRLDQIESQASEAEQRAERAERLADLRREEAERERKLHEMLERINEAERRAREAEARARQAVAGVTKPFDPGSAPPQPLPPEPDPEPLDRLAENPPAPFSSESPEAVGASESPESAFVTDAPAAEAEESPAAEAPDEPEDEPQEVTIRTSDLPMPGVLTGSPADHDEDDHVTPDFEGEGASEQVGGPSAMPAPRTDPVVEVEAPSSFEEISSGGGPINLNTATFEELREAGLSVTQTGRVLAHRERGGGFTSVDELDDIPGFPRDFLDVVKPKLTA